MRGSIRSWIKEELRLRPTPQAIASSLGLALLILTPVLILQVRHRADLIRRQEEASTRDSLAIIEAGQAGLQRTLLDWGHWTPSYRFVQGQYPDFVKSEVATTSLFDGGGVMVILDQHSHLLLTWSSGGAQLATHRDLVSCLKHNLDKLPTASSVVRLACRDGKGDLNLGLATRINTSEGTAAPLGTMAFFEPFYRKEYSPAIKERLHNTLERLTLAPSAGQAPLSAAPQGWLPQQQESAEPLEPRMYDVSGNPIALRHPWVGIGTLRAIGEDLVVILMLSSGLLVFRYSLMLERRRQTLKQLKLERQANNRIRRACQELDQLHSTLGLGAEGDAADTKVLSRMLHRGDLKEAEPSSRAQEGIDNRLERVAQRFQHFLGSATSLALLDSLTQLPNRRYFLEKLEVEAEQQKENGGFYSILFVDVDRFKSINDTYGHAVGDTTLIVLAERLKGALRPSDFLARYGGDELAILMDHSSDHQHSSEESLKQQAKRYASRIASAVRDPIQVNEASLEVSISIGISLVDPSKTSTTAAMQQADMAMYQAKRHKHARIAIFELSQGNLETDNYQLYVDLMRAVRERQLTVAYQPIVNEQGQLCTVEALARWQHPIKGMISPELFLELAEEHRQMGRCGDLLMDLSIEGFQLLMHQHPKLRLAINLTPSQLSDATLVDRMESHLHHHGVASERITIELTERSILEANETVESNLHRLRDLHVNLSLDDFGTGYSSLNLINKLQPEEVKIDKSFVIAMHNDRYAKQIVTMIATMAPNMGLEVIAEGVEDRETLQALIELGIKRFQGYFFHRPLPADQLVRALERQASQAA